jgi:hypothetical protein
MLQGLNAAHAAHADVHEDKVRRRSLFDERNALLATRSLIHLVMAGAEHSRKRVTDLGVIIDDEYGGSFVISHDGRELTASFTPTAINQRSFAPRFPKGSFKPQTVLSTKAPKPGSSDDEFFLLERTQDGTFVVKAWRTVQRGRCSAVMKLRVPHLDLKTRLACLGGYSAIVVWLSLVRGESVEGLMFFKGEDKVAHFCMYAGLCYLLTWAPRGAWRIGRWPYPFLIASTWGILMELAQAYFKNQHRSFDLKDILANTTGALCCSLLLHYIHAQNSKGC